MSKQPECVVSGEKISKQSLEYFVYISFSPRVVTSGLDVCDIYLRYKTTSYNTNVSTVELLDLRKVGIAVGILLLCALELEI